MLVLLGLKNTAQTEFINNKIKQKYATYFSKQPQLAAKNWEELSDYYQSVKQLYERILGTIKIILCVIAILAVSNSMLLIIHERRGEIGMLKAIGMKNSQILNIFIFEGAFLGIVGAVIGSFLAILFSLIVSAVGGIPMPPPPGSTQGYSLKFYLTFSEGFNVCILFILCIAMASFLAARKSIKLNIPIALASSLLFIFISVLSLSYEKKMFAHDLNTNIQNTSKQNETLFSAKEIFAKWEKLRGVAKDNFITETTFKNIDTTEEIKDKNPSIIYRVAVSSDFVLAVSISDKPGERMAILSSRDGLWLQKENMRKPMRVSPAQRLLGQASNGDVVGLKWARDYFPTEYINGVLIIKPLENTKSAAYGKIELDWDEKQEKASSARFFALSGKLLKTINYTYEGKGKLMKLKTALIQDAINHSLQTLVSFSETESSEFSSHFFNPQIILESMKKIIDFKRE